MILLLTDGPCEDAPEIKVFCESAAFKHRENLDTVHKRSLQITIVHLYNLMFFDPYLHSHSHLFQNA